MTPMADRQTTLTTSVIATTVTTETKKLATQEAIMRNTTEPSKFFSAL